MNYRDDIEAVYENGVLRPDRPLALPERSRVRLHVEDVAPAAAPEAKAALLRLVDEIRARGSVRVGPGVLDRESLLRGA